MRSFISDELALDLCKSLIHPHFNHADIIYDACNSSLQQKPQIHQNMALRAVLKVEPRFQTKKLHEQTGIKWLDSERKERCCIEAYEGIHNLFSDHVNHLFNRHTVNRSLRSANMTFFVPDPAKTSFGDCNLPNRCKSYWRQLPLEVCNIHK